MKLIRCQRNSMLQFWITLNWISCVSSTSPLSRTLTKRTSGDCRKSQTWIFFISPVPPSWRQHIVEGLMLSKHEGPVLSLNKTDVDLIGYIATSAVLLCGHPGWVQTGTPERGERCTLRGRASTCIINNRLTAAFRSGVVCSVVLLSAWL